MYNTRSSHYIHKRLQSEATAYLIRGIVAQEIVEKLQTILSESVAIVITMCITIKHQNCNLNLDITI